MKYDWSFVIKSGSSLVESDMRFIFLESSVQPRPHLDFETGFNFHANVQFYGRDGEIVQRDTIKIKDDFSSRMTSK